MNLNEQQLLVCHVLKICLVKVTNMWQALAKRLPSNIFDFCRKALILYLLNKSNLYCWKITEDRQSMLLLPPLCKHNFTSCQIVKNA